MLCLPLRKTKPACRCHRRRRAGAGGLDAVGISGVCHARRRSCEKVQLQQCTGVAVDLETCLLS